MVAPLLCLGCGVGGQSIHKRSLGDAERCLALWKQLLGGGAQRRSLDFARDDKLAVELPGRICDWSGDAEGRRLRVPLKPKKMLEKSGKLVEYPIFSSVSLRRTSP
jgi:hypothetical protein